MNNGQNVNGLIQDMKNVVGRGFLELSIATDHLIEDLDPLDNFTVMRRNNDMFIKPFDCLLYTSIFSLRGGSP